MRKFLICFALVIFSCSKQNNRIDNFNGDWSLIDVDSTYLEVEIRNDTIISFHEKLSFLPLKKFIVKNDSAFISYSYNNTENKSSYLIDYVNENEFGLISNQTDRRITFKKIDSSNLTFSDLKDYKETNRFVVDFMNRKNKLLGIQKQYEYRDTLNLYLKRSDTLVNKLN